MLDWKGILICIQGVYSSVCSGHICDAWD